MEQTRTVVNIRVILNTWMKILLSQRLPEAWQPWTSPKRCFFRPMVLSALSFIVVKKNVQFGWDQVMDLVTEDYSTIILHWDVFSVLPGLLVLVSWPVHFHFFLRMYFRFGHSQRSCLSESFDFSGWWPSLALTSIGAYAESSKNQLPNANSTFGNSSKQFIYWICHKIMRGQATTGHKIVFRSTVHVSFLNKLLLCSFVKPLELKLEVYA